MVSSRDRALVRLLFPLVPCTNQSWTLSTARSFEFAYGCTARPHKEEEFAVRMVKYYFGDIIGYTITRSYPSSAVILLYGFALKLQSQASCELR